MNIRGFKTIVVLCSLIVNGFTSALSLSDEIQLISEEKTTSESLDNAMSESDSLEFQLLNALSLEIQLKEELLVAVREMRESNGALGFDGAHPVAIGSMALVSIGVVSKVTEQLSQLFYSGRSVADLREFNLGVKAIKKEIRQLKKDKSAVNKRIREMDLDRYNQDGEKQTAKSAWKTASRNFLDLELELNEIRSAQAEARLNNFFAKRKPSLLTRWRAVLGSAMSNISILGGVGVVGFITFDTGMILLPGDQAAKIENYLWEDLNRLKAERDLLTE